MRDVLQFEQNKSCSSVGREASCKGLEHAVHTGEVTGSSPVKTTKNARFCLKMRQKCPTPRHAAKILKRLPLNREPFLFLKCVRCCKNVAIRIGRTQPLTIAVGSSSYSDTHSESKIAYKGLLLCAMLYRSTNGYSDQMPRSAMPMIALLTSFFITPSMIDQQSTVVLDL
jgi:hypothetical protein